MVHGAGALTAEIDEEELLESLSRAAESTAYREAIENHLEAANEAGCEQLAPLSRELAAQHVPLPQALAALWSAATPALRTAAESPSAGVLERVLEAQRSLAIAYDQAYEMQRRSHLRLASAYARKIREIATLLDNLPAFIFLKDLKFRYASVNRVYCEALEMPAQQVVSKTDLDLFPGEIANALAQHEQQVLDQQMPVSHEVTLPFGGQQRSVLFIKAPVLSPEGLTEGLIGVGFDLTERKRTEGERARLAAAVHAIGDAVWITDVSGAIQYVNPAFEEITGFGREQALGQNPRILNSGKHGQDFYRGRARRTSCCWPSVTSTACTASSTTPWIFPSSSGVNSTCSRNGTI